MSDEPARPVIVVGVDGSERSVGALRWAVAQARVTNAAVRAVMGWDVPVTIMITPHYVENDYFRDAQELLNEVVDEVVREEPGVPIETYMVQERPALALMRAAEGAQLLVIGSHGRGLLAAKRHGRGAGPHLHIGSVANYCVNHAPCPVLVYRG